MEDQLPLPEVPRPLQGRQKGRVDPSSPSLRLVLQPGGLIFPVHSSEIILGRNGECDILLPRPDVSRRHCRIQKNLDGWVLTDLSSLNGVYVNDIPVKTTQLHQDDRVQIGGFMFVVDLSGNARQMKTPSLMESIFQKRPGKKPARLAS